MTTEPESTLATRPSFLARLKDWNQQTAWREFDQDYGPLLRNVARKAGLTDAESDEVAQEALITVARKIGTFEHRGNRGSFRAWLYQQARWRIADQLRARNHRFHPQPSAHDAQKEVESQSAPHVELFQEIWDAEWNQHIRQLALERVKRQAGSRQFQLFDLHVLQGLPVKDAAQAAGASIASVFMAKSRIGRKVRRELERLKTDGGEFRSAPDDPHF